jgi:sRNA-binding protein
MTKPDRAQLDAVIALLAEVYPKTFSIEAKRRPLKIGIRESLQAALDGALTEDGDQRNAAALWRRLWGLFPEHVEIEFERVMKVVFAAACE